MKHEIGELTFLKQLAPRFAVPVPEFVEWPAQRKAVQDALAKWGAGIVKPDILAGGRGKAGAVMKVQSIQEAVRRFRKIVDRSGLKREVRSREYYEKPSDVKRKARNRAIRRAQAQSRPQVEGRS